MNKPIYTRLRVRSGVHQGGHQSYAEVSIAADARVVSDGLGYFAAMTKGTLLAAPRPAYVTLSL
jgi:hypothetical protein